MENRKISLCLTNYNRYTLLLDSFEQVLDDDRIDEIIIQDDCSNYETLHLLKIYCQDKPKIKLIVNPSNLGMSRNKAQSIQSAKNEWCIIFDSDNVIDKNYIDRLFEMTAWFPWIIYCPAFAQPNFDYRKYSNLLITKAMAKLYINEREFDCCMNTCNYFVNRQKYIDTYVYDSTVKESDTIWHNYNHLKSGGNMYIVPDMTYKHLVHKDSGWLQNAAENTAKANEIKQLITKL